MDLKNCIETTLTDIADAVYDARERTRGKVAIAPGEKDESSNIKTELGINVLGSRISAGVDGGKEDIKKIETEKISRISFKVPFSFSARFVEK